MGQIARALILAAAAGSIIASAAQAGGFAIREQSARGQGASFAGAAAGRAGLGSMFWNLAIITQYNGWNYQSNASLIMPRTDLRLNATVPAPILGFGANAGDIGQSAIVPASYSSYQVTDRIFLGFAMNSRFGLVTK